MSDDQKKLAAREYVDKQLETMRRYGSVPEDFSELEYQGLVEEVANAIELEQPPTPVGLQSRTLDP